ncbi:P34 [Xanthomonas phage phiL7]|uniref:p34 n=1 Tax=Xanthomonas phage phiL7 TaxID=538979 RepID=C4ML34_9CAUD|nr:P34 [Xanthomonas phage phiL7]ACE75774.1 P34 [Xanthomonas phage phiL7]
MSDYLGMVFAACVLVTSITVALAMLISTGSQGMHYKLVDEYCGEDSAVTYDVVGSPVGKRLMLTCEMPEVAP